MTDRIVIRTLGSRGPGKGRVIKPADSYIASYRFGGKTYHIASCGGGVEGYNLAQRAVDILTAKLRKAHEAGDAYLSIGIIHEFTEEWRNFLAERYGIE